MCQLKFFQHIMNNLLLRTTNLIITETMSMNNCNNEDKSQDPRYRKPCVTETVGNFLTFFDLGSRG